MYIMAPNASRVPLYLELYRHLVRDDSWPKEIKIKRQTY